MPSKKEPPEWTKIILTSDQPAHARHDTFAMSGHSLRPLGYTCRWKLLQNQMEDGMDEVSARFSAGSLGRATELLETGLLESRTDIFESLFDTKTMTPVTNSRRRTVEHGTHHTRFQTRTSQGF